MDQTTPKSGDLLREPGPELAAALSRLAHLPPEGRLDALLLDQQTRWSRGERVAAEAYTFADPALAGTGETLLYLISGEMRLRASTGETLNLAEYRGRFPEHADTITRQIEVESALQMGERSGAISNCSTLSFEDSAPSTFEKPGVPGYEILGELGRGGMGVVYKARQAGLNRVVALKMILPGKAQTQTMRERFRREGEHIARLKHPNIVPVFAYGEHDGHLYFALEYVAGGSLGQKLHAEASKPWQPRDAARLVAGLAGAMAYAHGKGIIHRDLKPGNILLDEKGEPHITDFGLARQALVSDLTLEGAVVGTPAYMAPEQASGHTDEIGPAADVFGLGAILYQLLTGKPPYQGIDVRTTLRQAEQGQVVPVREVNPAVPKGLARIVDKALAPSIKDRYQSAEQLRKALEGYLAPVNGWLIGTVAAFCLLLAGGIGLAIVKPWERPQQVERPGPDEKQPRPAVQPLEGDLTVLFYQDGNADRSNRSVMEKGVLPIRNGEKIQIHVKLNRKAHIHVVWIDAEGVIDPFYPWDRANPKALLGPTPVKDAVARIEFPSDPGKGYRVIGKSGLETVMMMARETPLPDDVRLTDLLGRIDPTPLRQETEAAYRGQNGQRSFNFKSVDRGLAKEAEDIDAAVLKLMAKVSKHFDLVRIVRFAHKE